MRARGFSLVEVAVAIACAGVILTVVVSTYSVAVRNERETEMRASMIRQGAYVAAILDKEIAQAGTGVPRGPHIVDAYDGAGVTQFYAAVIVGAASQIGIVADLPRPDAQYNAFGLMHNRFGTNQHHIMWHTENNGICAPDNVPSCTTGQTSLFFPGEVGCNTTSAAADRTCPWGMRRVEAGERIQVVAGDGSWTHQAMDAPLSMHNHGGLFLPRLQFDWDPVWPNDSPTAAPVGVGGVGWVASVDRVFYRLNGTNIERIQCFGDPSPSNANFPNATATAIPASTVTPAPAGSNTAASTCVGPEVVAQNVASLTFTYFDDTNTAMALPLATGATKSLVRRVDYVIEFSRTVLSRPVQHAVVGTIRIRNL